jgi:2'-5' RNA ligase
MHRLFFAALPPPPAVAAVVALADGLRREGAGGRWVDPERFHVTLLFVGTFAQAPDAQARAAAAAATAVGANPFDLVLDHLRGFPGRRPPWVLAGAEGESPAAALSGALRTALTQAGVEHEAPRPFVPHLTLLYADAALPAARTVAPIGWRVESCALGECVPGDPPVVQRAQFPQR